MTGKPLPPDEPGAQKRFDRVIKNALATPHKGRKPKLDDAGPAPDGREPDPNNPTSGVGRNPS